MEPTDEQPAATHPTQTAAPLEEVPATIAPIAGISLIVEESFRVSPAPIPAPEIDDAVAVAPRIQFHLL
jgi:hypothetical protein